MYIFGIDRKLARLELYDPGRWCAASGMTLPADSIDIRVAVRIIGVKVDSKGMTCPRQHMADATCCIDPLDAR